MKKKKVALVFGITGNYVFALANTLIGLVRHNNKFWDDIIVYYDNMQIDDQNKLNKITSIKFQKFDEIKAIANISPIFLKKYSVATFYRFECFNLLKEYQYVIWNDVDILIQGDISELLEYGNKSGFAATLSTANAFVETNFNGLIPKYDMLRTCYNAGILVLSDKLENYEEMTKWCFNATTKYAEKLRWMDQGIINLLLQEYKIDVENIDIVKYCCHPTLIKEKECAKIIHAYGDRKFWNDIEYQEIYPEWLENDSNWEEICQKEAKNTKLPLVSCIMTAYKKNQFLKESINSILDQTYKNFEIIFVIEYSEDQSEIESQLLNFKDERIKIIKNASKLGLAKSLNIAMENAKGKYLARMDDDDISLPKRFKKQVEFLESHKEVGICGTAAQVFGKNTGIIEAETNPEKLKIITLTRTPFIHPTVMMRKEFMDKYNLKYDHNYFTEDYELWSRCINYFPISNLDEILLMYRSSNISLTSSGNNEEKIHASHIKVMNNQVRNYLNYEPTRDELEYIQGRKDIIKYCHNKEELLAEKSRFIEKLIKLNNEIKFYNISYFNEAFSNNIINNKKSSFLKKIIKFFLRPFYSRLRARIDADLEYRDYILNEKIDFNYKTLDDKIKNISSEK